MIEGSTLVLLEFLLIFGGVIGFGIWQLMSLRRANAEAARKKQQQANDT